MVSRTVDVAVIGGGVMGVCTAYHVVRAGRSVVLLERGTIAGPPPRSSSGDLARVFRSAYGEGVAMTRLCRESLEWWRTLETEAEDRFVTPCGMLVRGDASWATASHRTLTAEGLTATWSAMRSCAIATQASRSEMTGTRW